MGLFDLFKPAWQSKDVLKATKAVERITDEEKLKMIAKNTKNGAALFSAVEKITDEAFLKEIALNDSLNSWSLGSRMKAIEKINDEVFLQKIILEDSNSNLRIAAVRKLTGQDILINIAKDRNEKDWYLRKIAVEKIECQTLLTDIVKSEMNVDVRLAALRKLEDKELVKKHVYFDYEYSPKIRFDALNKSFDASLLKSIAAIDPAYGVRKRAIGLLNITVPSKGNSYYAARDLASSSAFRSMMDSAKSGIVKPYSPMNASSALTALTNPESTNEMRIYAARTIAEEAIKYISYSVNLSLDPDLELLAHENAINNEIAFENDFAGIEPLIASYLKNIGIGLMSGTNFPTKAYRLVYLLSNERLLQELFTFNSHIYEYQQIKDAAAIMLADRNILPHDSHIELESKFHARKDNNKLASTSVNFENNEIKPLDTVKKFIDMDREEGVEYINKMDANELMELILFGEDGQEVKDIAWLCSRLASKMMISKEGDDMCGRSADNMHRKTIEKFFHVFSGAGTLSNFRSINGFWQPREAENAFTQVMLQFAGLPQNIRDMHKNLYNEHYGK